MKITAFDSSVPYSKLLWSRWVVAQVASLANIVLWVVQQMLSDESLASRIGELSPRNWSWISRERQVQIRAYLSSEQRRDLFCKNPRQFDSLIGWSRLSKEDLVYLMQEHPQTFADFAYKLTQRQAEALLGKDQFHQLFDASVYLVFANKVGSQFLEPLWNGYIAKQIKPPLNKEMIGDLVKSKKAQILLDTLVAEGNLKIALWTLEKTGGNIPYSTVSFQRLFDLLNRPQVTICWETLLPLAGGEVDTNYCALILSKCPLDLSEKLLQELYESTTAGGRWHSFLQQIVERAHKEPDLAFLVGKYLGMQKTAWSACITESQAWPKCTSVCPRIDSWHEVEAWEEATCAPFKIEWLQNTLPSVQHIWAIQATPKELLRISKSSQKSPLARAALSELMRREEDLSSPKDIGGIRSLCIQVGCARFY